MNEILEQLNIEQFNIVDGMIDWVRVVDKSNTVIYANKMMLKDLGNDIIGKKCYSVLQSDKKCTNCISFNTLMTGKINNKESEYNGKIYNVISSPLKNSLGEIIASVEVFRDITKEKQLAKCLKENNTKMVNDLRFAKNMQKRMLPPKGNYNGLNISYIFEPSEMLSGDVFDVFQIDSENTGIYMCDVVGHGVSASLLTMFVRQSLRTISKNSVDINKIMGELHKTFLGLNLDADKYFSIFFGIYNKNKKTFTYVNAGHNTAPIVLEEEKITELKAIGYPICNLFDSVEYDESSINLHKGDKLIFYTDGIVEAKNKDNEEFGTNRLINIIKKRENILDSVNHTFHEFCGKQKDDYAMLMLEIIE